ncbi:MAG: 30S ribosomal protein S16 [Acidobacteriota bacterium]
MLKIRLRRMGSRHRPFYRVVVSDSRRTPTASSIEEVGYYNPRTQPVTLNLNIERVEHWMSHGAQPSDTVKRLVAQAKAAPSEAPAAEAEAAEEPAAEAEAAEEPTAEAEAAEEPAATEEPAAEAEASAEPEAEAAADDDSAEAEASDGDAKAEKAADSE